MKKIMSMIIALALSASMTAYADMAGNTAEESGTAAAVAETGVLQAKKGIAEVGYGSKNEKITFRKGSGTDDISGDYNEYTKTADVKINGQTVTLRGHKSKVYSAIWCGGTDSFSFYVKQGVSAKTAKKLVSALIAANS